MSAETKIVAVAIDQVKGFIAPTEAERAAAYELLIELTTRPTSAQLAVDDVTLTAELESVEEMFDLTRQILRTHGADTSKGSAGNLSLAVVALRVLNEVFRPVLDRWAPLLAAERPDDLDDADIGEWERTWPPATRCRADLNTMRASTRAYIETLAHIAGTPAIADAVLSAPSSMTVPTERIDQPRRDPNQHPRPRTKMVSWLDPAEAARCAWAVHRGERSERAARDRPAVVERDDGVLRPTWAVDAEPDTEFWFDYVADMGDAFDGTAPVAWLMGRHSLRLPQRDAHEIPTPPATMPRADLVVFGGDEIYPYAAKGWYERHTELPFQLGLEGGPDGSDPVLVSIPGNHDWMGGLEHFDEMFASGRAFADHWQTPQRNPYWHVRLPQGWWLWGIDTGLHNRLVGAAQEQYFREAAEQLRPGDRVLLCTPVPLWQLRSKYPEAYATLRATFDPMIANRDATMPLCLSGDTHMFAHYERVDVDGVEDHICSGGGGAFLQPTHNLAERIPVERGSAEFRITSRWPLSADSRALAPGAKRLLSAQYLPLFVLGALLQLLVTFLAGFDQLRLWDVTVEAPEPSDGGEPRQVHATSPDDLGLPDLVRWVTGIWPVLIVVAVLAVACIVPFRGNSVEPKLGKAASGYGMLVGAAMGATFVVVEAVRLWFAPPLADLDAAVDIIVTVLMIVIGGIAAIGVFLALTRWVNGRIKAADTLTFLPAQSTRFKNFVRFRIDRHGDLTAYVIGMDPVGAGWYEAMTLQQQASAAVPPYDPAGTPRLHYVWGRTYPKFRPTPIDIAVSISEAVEDPSAEPAQPHRLDRPLQEAFETLASELIAAGHTLLYGGLPGTGVTQTLRDADSEAHRTNPNASPHVVNYVAAPLWTGKDVPGVGLVPVPPAELHHDEGIADDERALRQELADYSAMRAKIADHAAVWIAIGGRWLPRQPGTRLAPGVLEEACIALDRRIPLLVAGGFGGAAGKIAEALLGRLDRRAAESLAAQFLDDGATFLEMIDRFRSVGQLRNGLTPGENRELLTSRDSATVEELVRRSIHRIAERS